VTNSRALRSNARGSATVEFALVTPLLLVVMLGVLQVALALHVRSTAIAAAAEGARMAAMLGSDPDLGVERTEQVLRENIAGTGVRTVTARRAVHEGLQVLSVEVVMDLPLIGFLGPTEMRVRAHALDETW
jgi:Flp pilus assembly protein TadG